VDASEGPLPQTRFVLGKALEAGVPAGGCPEQNRPPRGAAGRGAARAARPPDPRCVRGRARGGGLEPVVCLNKIDRPDARPAEVLDEIYGLFIDLGANEQQLEFPVVYTNARAGTPSRDLATAGTDLRPLFETIVGTLPGPAHDPEAPTQFQANNLGYDDYVGRIAIGRVVAGQLEPGGQYALGRADGTWVPCKLTRVYGWQGVPRPPLERGRAGGRVAVG